jgi:uncharacterized membrane protein HdeD (DUF308 family)
MVDGIFQNRISSILSGGWWRLLLRGLAAIAFGLLTWFQPRISLAALVFLFGGYCLVDGILSTWTAIAGRKQFEDWWVLLLAGLIGIGVAFITFTTPGITAIALVFYIAIWAIARGVLEIAAAIRLRKEIKGEWLLILAGLASLAFGALIMSRPTIGALAILAIIAVYAIVFGVILVILAFKARGFAKDLESAGPSSSTHI